MQQQEQQQEQGIIGSIWPQSLSAGCLSACMSGPAGATASRSAVAIRRSALPLLPWQRHQSVQGYYKTVFAGLSSWFRLVRYDSAVQGSSERRARWEINDALLTLGVPRVLAHSQY